MLKSTTTRFERERRLLRRAGVTPGDETYDLLLAIVVLPAALKRTLFALLAVACMLIAVIAGTAFLVHQPDGISILRHQSGYLVIVDRAKGVAQVPCSLPEVVCLQVNR